MAKQSNLAGVALSSRVKCTSYRLCSSSQETTKPVQIGNQNKIDAIPLDFLLQLVYNCIEDFPEPHVGHEARSTQLRPDGGELRVHGEDINSPTLRQLWSQIGGGERYPSRSDPWTANRLRPKKKERK